LKFLLAMCDTLGFCCKRIAKNEVFGYTLATIACIFGIIIGYFIVISYGCLWSQYIWHYIIINPSPSCTPIDYPTFFIVYVFTGALDLVITAGILATIGAIGWGIFWIFGTCINCCYVSYKGAEIDVHQKKLDETTTLLKVNDSPV